MKKRDKKLLLVFFILALLLLSIELCKYNFYIIKQGMALFQIYSKTIPVEKVLEDPSTSKKTKDFLNKTIGIRQFAYNYLGLSQTKNYNAYMETSAAHLVTVICASDIHAFTQKQWRFFFTDFPYIGFFYKNDALAYYNYLKSKSLDVFIYPADGFSTLGYLQDPLFSFMKKYTDYYLAELLIHEMVHSTIFIKNDIELSENLAEFIGKTGALLYLHEKNYSESYIKSIQDSQKDDAAFSKDLFQLYQNLSIIYSTTPEYKIISEKSKQIENFKFIISNNTSKNYMTNKYSNINSMVLNNASILIMLTYSKQFDKISYYYKNNNFNLKDFIVFCKKNKKKLKSLF